MNRKKILAFALGPMLGSALGFISLPLIAWHFSPEDIGRNNVYQIAISFAILLCVLRLDQAYVREYHEAKDRPALFKACFLPGLVLLIVLLLASLPFASDLAKALYGENNPEWYLLTASCVILSFAGRFLSLIVRMQERGLAYSISQVFPRIVVIGALICYAALDVQAIYSCLLWANLLSVFMVVLVFGWNTKSEWIPAIRTQVQRKELGKLLNFGAPLIVAGVAYWGLSASSTIALRAFSDFRELGIYSMAMSFAGAAAIFQSIFSTVWMPTVYRWVAEKEDLRRIDAVTSQVLAAVCFLFALAGMFSWVIDFVLPPGYTQVKSIVVCCMAQPLLYTLSEATVVGLNVQRKSIHAMGIALLALTCNALLGVALIPRFGAAGAAVSNAIAYAVFFIARTEASARLWRAVPRKQLYAMVVIVTVLSIGMALAPRALSLVPLLAWALIFISLLFVFRKELRIWRYSI